MSVTSRPSVCFLRGCKFFKQHAFSYRLGLVGFGWLGHCWVWVGLDWLSRVRSALVGFGRMWSGSVWFGRSWLDLWVLVGLVWFGWIGRCQFRSALVGWIGRCRSNLVGVFRVDRS